ncbi:hypothetical protein BV22DRAFT_998586 [Leucogyrophana mollusca]|uniref:Uncharacterized protein n=1 Tax=Leucogyrophana mollusca TaxID=85980 RepID=A0ACB8C037_9AGAM|nr:hypothetical protein BV22DRAFT_998586 [Leucogyrophana mollusca]
MTGHDFIPGVIGSLVVPTEFSHYERIADSDTTIRLERWKGDARIYLSQVQDLVDRGEHLQLSLKNQADIVTAVAAFDGQGSWISEPLRKLATKILEAFSEPTDSMLEQILSQNVKPVFRSNPHPYLSEATGRKLPRAAGGPMASQDAYEDQTWKSRPGISNVISWCIGNASSRSYESLWHLIIPPVMTFLDDYEARYKLCGIQLASNMLKSVPRELLRRTGVDGLLLRSLLSTLNHLRNPETPSLIRAAVPATLSLIHGTTAPGSSQRFEQLCSLLGDGIIGGVWIYAYADPDTIEASIDVLPDIIITLGIGAARYLKALIPQLVHPLIPVPLTQPSGPMQLAALRALGTVIDVCAPRMCKWKCTILEGVGKCWVSLVDSGAEDEKAYAVKVALRDTCAKLAIACPTIVEGEYSQMVAFDPILFKGLVIPLEHVESQ